MTNASADSRIERVAAWICWYASSQQTGLTSIQFVKYLYLADLYHARRFGGRTITGWPWAFVHFGPYCSEAIQTIERVSTSGLVQAQRYESRYSEDEEFSVYRRSGPEPEAIDSVLTLAEMGDLKKAIKRWSDDTAGLLDYVYFATEPMEGVRPRDRLDFSKSHLPIIETTTNIETSKLPEKKKRKARDAIARLKDRTLVGVSADDERLRDADYATALTSDIDRGEPPSVSDEYDISKLIDLALDDR